MTMSGPAPYDPIPPDPVPTQEERNARLLGLIKAALTNPNAHYLRRITTALELIRRYEEGLTL